MPVSNLTLFAELSIQATVLACPATRDTLSRPTSASGPLLKALLISCAPSGTTEFASSAQRLPSGATESASNLTLSAALSTTLTDGALPVTRVTFLSAATALLLKLSPSPLVLSSPPTSTSTARPMLEEGAKLASSATSSTMASALRTSLKTARFTDATDADDYINERLFVKSSSLLSNRNLLSNNLIEEEQQWVVHLPSMNRQA